MAISAATAPAPCDPQFRAINDHRGGLGLARRDLGVGDAADRDPVLPGFIVGTPAADQDEPFDIDARWRQDLDGSLGLAF